MKISGLLLSAGFIVAALGRVAAHRTFPLYSGTVPNSQPNRVEETSGAVANRGVCIFNVGQPNLTAFLPPAGMANGTAIIICPGEAATPGFDYAQHKARTSCCSYSEVGGVSQGARLYIGRSILAAHFATSIIGIRASS